MDFGLLKTTLKGIQCFFHKKNIAGSVETALKMQYITSSACLSIMEEVRGYIKNRLDFTFILSHTVRKLKNHLICLVKYVLFFGGLLSRE